MRDAFNIMDELCGTCGDRMGNHYGRSPGYTCPPNSNKTKRWKHTGRYRSQGATTIRFKATPLLLLLEQKP